MHSSAKISKRNYFSHHPRSHFTRHQVENHEACYEVISAPAQPNRFIQSEVVLERRSTFCNRCEHNFCNKSLPNNSWANRTSLLVFMFGFFQFFPVLLYLHSTQWFCVWNKWTFHYYTQSANQPLDWGVEYVQCSIIIYFVLSDYSKGVSWWCPGLEQDWGRTGDGDDDGSTKDEA